jgi:hypothetical protein
MPMPNMRDVLRGIGRRVTVQVIKQKTVDHEAVQQGVALSRLSVVLTPMPARKIAIKPEGQRKWKWWTCTSSAQLRLGWFLKADKDERRLYEVMEEEDWGQARVFTYGVAEAPR